MFDREFDNTLKTWKLSKSRKPLVLRGARQVGKSTAVRRFGKSYSQFMEFNLDQASERRLFESNLSSKEMVSALFFEKGASINNSDTLLFIDEIQNSDRATALLRYFKEEFSEFHVIAAGSMLEHYINDEKASFPVGRVEYRFMRPLSFFEFLGAIGEHQACEELTKVPLAPYAHAKLSALFARYAMTGGMPEVVANWCEHQDMTVVKDNLQALLTSYGDDARKYAKSREFGSLLQHVISMAPLEAGKRIVFEKFGNSNIRSREMGDALRTLERALLIELIYPITAWEAPLVANQRKRPRLQFLDTGLMNHACNTTVHLLHGADISGVAEGRIAEHIVGQELETLNSTSPRSLCFWVRESNQSHAEIDYIFVHEGRTVPVEVKAGASGSLRSLHQFVDSSGCPLAVRFWSGPPKIENQKTPAGTYYKLANLPHYLAGNLPRYLDGIK
ncbi:MAG: AAA family ATPase [Pseudomonadota bacterium]